MRPLSVVGGTVIVCALLFLPVFAFGQGPPASDFSNLCQGIAGAGAGISNACDPQNAVTETILPQTAKLLLNIVAGLSVLFIVWGGILMLISMGDDSKTAQAKWAIVYALVGLFGAILSQAFVGTVAQPEALLGAGATEATVIRQAVKFLVNAVNVIFISVIIFAGIRMLVGHGQPEEFTRAKKVIAWAIMGAVTVNVARTLVRAVLSLFGI